MSTHRHIDKICLVAAILSLILCAVFMNGEALGIQAASKAMGYENRLFDTSKVHTIDIIIDDWDAFLDTAQSEEYSVCSVVIDGETISNVGIRGKGNTSLSTVSRLGSERYSFKIEFDQYDSTKNYHGLDKLSLNNLIQDNTMMKDYLTYQMMHAFGAAAPLCSYAYITVNGEDWGLYLAIEAVEESFLQRNYGSNYGDLYKPDSMNFGGGRGNGRDFDMADFMNRQENTDTEPSGNTVPDFSQRGQWGNGNTPSNGMQASGQNESGTPSASGNTPSFGVPGQFPGGMPGGFGRENITLDEDMIRNAFAELGLDASVLDGLDFDTITMETLQSVLTGLDEETVERIMQKIMGSVGMQMPGMGGRGGFGGMGSSDVKLQYIDDDPNSYGNIFNSAKTSVTEADQKRLIASLKQLSAYKDLDEVVNIDDVLRYFVVHNFVVNGDSYTGSMIHNYYLYEEDGRLSMIPWDYNLAFGTFQRSDASSSVNYDIDEVLSDRPMQAWIFSNEIYSQQYYSLYTELLEQVDAQSIIDSAYELIAPYVEKDPTTFCTYAEFQSGVETLKAFCTLRSESVGLQLSGSAETVDVEALDLSQMGTMHNGMGGFGGRGGFGGMDLGNRGNFNTEIATDSDTNTSTVPRDSSDGDQGNMQLPDGMQMPEWMELPEGMQVPGGMQQPGNGESFESSFSQDSNSDDDNTTGNTSPNGADGFRNFSPPGETLAFGNMGNFSGIMNNSQSSGTSQTTAVLLAVSVLFLAIGLIIAFKFKR